MLFLLATIFIFVDKFLLKTYALINVFMILPFRTDFVSFLINSSRDEILYYSVY